MKTALILAKVFRYDCKAMFKREVGYVIRCRTSNASVGDVLRIWEYICDCENQPVRQILIEEQPHEPTGKSLPSRSAGL